MKDPADDVKETPDVIRNRLGALKKGRPTMEKNLSALRLAVHNAERQLEQHDRNIKVLEEVLELQAKPGFFEVAVERVPEEEEVKA